MESGKGMSPETSSEENNDGVSDLVNGEAGQRSGARRSYECTYCKRGFTNAQALGGHMNIHRKDRAKAKQNSASSQGYFHTQSDRDTPNIPHVMISSSPTPFSSHLPNWYQVDNQSNYANFHDQPSSGPSFPYGYSEFETPRVMSHSLAMNEELMCADLSLQIDSSRYFDREDNIVGARVLVNDELDLELRLGHG